MKIVRFHSKFGQPSWSKMKYLAQNASNLNMSSRRKVGSVRGCRQLTCCASHAMMSSGRSKPSELERASWYCRSCPGVFIRTAYSQRPISAGAFRIMRYRGTVSCGPAVPSLAVLFTTCGDGWGGRGETVDGGLLRWCRSLGGKPPPPQ